MASSFNKNCLDDKIALITGGGSGICYEIANTFLKYGATVYILSRNKEKLLRAEMELNKGLSSQRCFSIPADVRKFDQINDAVDIILKKSGKLDILINGAAGNFLCPISQLSYNAFKTVMEIDAHGTFIVSQICFNKWFENNGGVIIHISMTLHYTGTMLQLHAGAAKAAIDAMTKHMAVEFGPYNVRVNGIAPGPIEGTVGLSRLGGFDESYLDKMREMIPLRRMGSAEDVANTALFLCISEAKYITGSTIVVDGGHWLTSSSSILNISKI